MARHFWANNSLAAISWRMTWEIGLPHFGHVAIVPLSEFELGPKGGESPKTVRVEHTIKHRVLKMALLGQHLNRNNRTYLVNCNAFALPPTAQEESNLRPEHGSSSWP
jgi:hypothetical protein